MIAPDPPSSIPGDTQHTWGYYPPRRVKLFLLHARFIGLLMGRTITLSGLPAEAEYLRAWHNPENDCFYLLYSHPSFEEEFVGVCPCPEGFSVTEHHEAHDETPKV